ncbi:hypothetical protein DFH28DRAFT_1184695 [Melampsora americana]|nr:hypothetical protein DFH28DRAFT_1184695 [Melampsora americana]
MPDQSTQLKTQFNNLPHELLYLVIESFADQSEIQRADPLNSGADSWLLPSTIRELLNLRLVCKAWAKVVPRYTFQSIRLTSRESVEALIKYWKDSNQDSHSSPVKRLIIGRLEYWDVSGAENPEEELERFQHEFDELGLFEPNFVPISMEQSTELIKLLGHNLTSLSFEFINSMGFSAEMIESIKQIKCLKKLKITKRDGIPIGNHNHSESLTKLLNVTSNLESLTFYFEDLEILNLEPQALSRLKHFCLKVIEWRSFGIDDLGIAIKPVKESLESLFTESIPNRIPNEVRNLNFPNLRVVRGFFWLFDETEPIIELEWLQWPIFKNVRTLIMDFRWAKDYWRIALEQVGEGTLGKPPNLKHFIFTTGILDYTPEYEPLIRAFKSQGIQCHFMPDPSYDQFLVRTLHQISQSMGEAKFGKVLLKFLSRVWKSLEDQRKCQAEACER